jgi:hypothetical protein
MKFCPHSVLVMFAALSVTACASTPSDIRAAVPPKTVETQRAYDAFVGCIADRVITKFKMQTLPTERGTSFVYDFGTQGFGKSAMLVDVVRGTPVKAEIYVKGGPWLGRDKLLVQAVTECAHS